MATYLDKLTADMKAAMRAGEKDKLTVVRMLISDIKKKAESDGELSDDDEAAILQKSVKMRSDTIEQAKAAMQSGQMPPEMAKAMPKSLPGLGGLPGLGALVPFGAFRLEALRTLAVVQKRGTREDALIVVVAGTLRWEMRRGGPSFDLTAGSCVAGRIDQYSIGLVWRLGSLLGMAK